MPYKIINCENLVHNTMFFMNLLPKNTLLCAVVKSNAYGNDLKCIVPTINNLVQYYAVNSVNEALKLRKITSLPILVLGKFNSKKLGQAIKKQIEFCVDSLEDIQILKKYNAEIKIHIAINSGMNRLGLSRIQDCKTLLEDIKKYKNLKIQGVFSHIGDAINTKRTTSQYRQFLILSSVFPASAIHHISNTDALLYHPNMSMDMVRVGIGLYGYGNINLMPCMSVYAKIIAIHNVYKGEYLGYGSEHKLKQDKKIAVVDIGYADGLPRTYSKSGKILINGNSCKIVANICMNMTIVDISNIDCKVGDTVTILGYDGKLSISAQDIASACNTIPYEILTNFSKLKNKKG